MWVLSSLAPGAVILLGEGTVGAEAPDTDTDSAEEDGITGTRPLSLVLRRSSFIMLPSGFWGWKGRPPEASKFPAMSSKCDTLLDLLDGCCSGCCCSEKLLIRTSLTDCGVDSVRTTATVRFKFTGASATAFCLTSMISPAFPSRLGAFTVNSRGC